MIKLTKDRILYLTIALVMLADLGANLLLSILNPDFKWETLLTASFWLSVGITQFLTLTAYFTFIALGDNRACKGDDIVALTQEVKTKFREVDNLYLAPDLDKYIRIENLKYRCDAYVEKLNKKLSRVNKSNSELRKQLITEKNECIEWRNYYNDVNLGVAAIKPDNDFDVEIESCKPNWINARTFKSVSKEIMSREIGSYKPGEVIAKDSKTKIALSIFGTCLFAVIGMGSLKGGWQGVYDACWRTLMISLNAYLGYQEGKKVVEIYKVSAFDEKKSILNDFYNKMFKLGKIKTQPRCESSKNEKIDS